MKKLFALVLALTLVLFVGCTDENLLYQDNCYLVEKGENGVSVSVEVIASCIPSVYDAVKEEIDVTNMPCLAILNYKDGILTVSSFNYDGDAKDEFKLWKLDADDNITFKSISVTDTNGDISIENTVLPKEEYKYIGEHYTYGYFRFNDIGKVTKVIFYGENIIEK